MVATTSAQISKHLDCSYKLGVGSGELGVGSWEWGKSLSVSNFYVQFMS
ncbi:hypothetical protein NSP_38300 [Nodularia spumigena CCY9414]|nr:hypothetical protein NSP_38300 [Nodularia spumigena CCY9414]